MLVINKILFFFMLLSVCFVGICKRNNCQINGDIKYLNTQPFFVLNSGDKNIKLPDPCVDYDIPNIIENTVINNAKVGKELNICPPILLIDVLKESCIIENEDNSN